MQIKISTNKLWECPPGLCEEIPVITEYIPQNIKHTTAVVILPGGGYGMRAPHEGEGYARFLAKNGYCAFVVEYRVSPHKFPIPLEDARRGMRYVRFHADKWGIDKNRVLIMGSSAGGHLAALTSVYYKKTGMEVRDEIDAQPFVPNGQILCYPVIKLLGNGVTHFGSGKNLLGDKLAEKGEGLSPDLIAGRKTPPAFIWHTMNDNAVNVLNSIDYMKTLKHNNIAAELHIFPDGYHGLGLADGKLNAGANEHVAQWSGLMIKWIKYMFD